MNQRSGVRLVAFSGHTGSGKSLAARLLRQLCPHFQERAFAHRLKEVVATMTRTSMDDQYSEQGKNTRARVFGDRTLGELQQQVGTLFRSQFSASVWVDSLFQEFDPQASFWIVTDVRFPNEVQAIKERGGLVFRLEGDPGGARARSTRDLQHPSETALDSYDQWDGVIDNSVPDVEAFEAQLRALVVPRLATAAAAAA